MVSASGLSPTPPPIRKPPKGKTLAAVVGAPAALLMIAVVGRFEGKANDPYQDIVGVWTVCYGETQGTMRHYTDAECKDKLSSRLVDYAGPVLARNPELAGHDGPLAAAVSLSYNIGNANYARSGVAREFSAGHWRKACDAFLSWRFAGGREIAGLVKRRQAERAMCLQGVPNV